MPRGVFALSFAALVACTAAAQDRYMSYSDVQIDFPPVDRMPSDSEAMAAALRTPLSPCS
jgi:hypothetical protein